MNLRLITELDNKHVRCQGIPTRFPTQSLLPWHPHCELIRTSQDEQSVENSESHLQGFVCFQKRTRCYKPWIFTCYNGFSISSPNLECKTFPILLVSQESRHPSLRGGCSWFMGMREKSRCFNTPFPLVSRHSKKPSLWVLLLFSDLLCFATCFKMSHYTPTLSITTSVFKNKHARKMFVFHQLYFHLSAKEFGV